MHQEALNDKGRELWPILKQFPEFYLAGGTALALQIGHRVSVDFDLFSSDYIEKKLLSRIQKIAGEREIVVETNSPDELTVGISGVKFTFLRYPFPIIEKFIEEEGVRMLGIREIGATKAYTAGRRSSFKDYVDLYFILMENHASLQELIDISKAKYGGNFNDRLFLEQLVYLDDVEEIKLQFLQRTVTKAEIKTLFSERIKELLLNGE